MAVYRVNKNRGYTVMANYHLRDKTLSLKAVGLLSKMLSFNDGWQFSTKGLSMICKEGPDAVLAALRELEDHGYLVRHRQRDSKGRMSNTVFEIYEQPQPVSPHREKPDVDNPDMENPHMENPHGENPAQLNTNQVITNERNNSLRNYQSINLDGMDRMDEREQYRELIRDNLEIDIRSQDRRYDLDRVNEIVEIMLDAVCSTSPTIRMESTARQVIGIVSRKVPLFEGIIHEPDIGQITNNAKVTDHHAIIPTVQFEKQDLAELPESEQKIIRLIAMRLLSATGEKHIYDETSVTLTCEGYEFKAKGKTVVQDGWKSVERCFKETLKSKEKDEPERSLPSLNEKDILSSVDSSVTEHYTSPPKPYTEDSLLSAMETAGNAEFDDDTEKKGLGTPATRAGIIEKLVKGGFVERKGKSLVPTKDGNNLVCVLPEQITSPSMTAEWENTLMQIERGNADADKFLSGIVGMTSELVKAYPFLSDAEANRFDTGRESIGKCPRCGSPVYVGKGNYYCSNKECSFCMWEDNKFFTSKKKKLTKKIAAELLDKGWCRVTGLYTPKRPQLYDAVIRLDDTGGKYVSFKMEFDR